MLRTKGFRGCLAALLVLAAGGLAGCERSQQQTAGKAPPPPQVTVARPVARTIVDQDEYVGRFVAVDAVEVRARVSGYLDSIHFKDGQIIRKGDLLFTVDRRPFQNALDQARGSLAQARANLAYAESDLARADGLINGNVISKQTFDQRTQAKRVAEASVTAQEAAVRQAALDLEFTELRAPVTGRIGDRRVSVGNLVTGGTTGTTTLLATIQSTDPIRFEFTMDEGSYLRYVRAARKVADFANDGGNVPGEAQADRRADLRPSGPDGFRRQCHRPLIRHHPRTCGVRQPEGHLHARHVRARPGCLGPAGRGAAGSRRRHRHRAGAQVRARRRRPGRGQDQVRDARARRRRAARDRVRPGGRATASSSTA